MANCNHDCSSCDEKGCGERKSFLETPKETTKIKKMIAVMSGKGGVGKSYIASLLAVCSQKNGLKTAIMDVDITGPSIPKAFGFTTEKADGDENGIYPAISRTGIEIMSINLLLEEETTPVIWRGPVINGVVKQFYTDVYWGDLDIMFIDMPPGTGDVPLTVFQSLPIDGIVVVTTPQDLAGMIVEKAVNMANMMNIPMLGIVENMSYITCPNCGEIIYPFGEGKGEEIANRYGLELLAKLPINGENRVLVDMGRVEDIDSSVFDAFIEKIGR